MTNVERIEIIEGRCIGAGSCVEAAEDYFDQGDDDALVIVLKNPIDPADRDRVQRATEVCPVLALRIASAA